MNILTLGLAVMCLNIFAYLTIRIRPLIYKTKLFRPMIWNIKLSVLPLLALIGNMFFLIVGRYISTLLNSQWLDTVVLIITTLLFLAWLLLLPNSGYLITELNLTHRDMDEVEVPIWYDIVSVLSLALSGIVNTLMCISLLQTYILIIFDPKELTSKNHLLLFAMAAGIIILVNIGIYLGRAIRFNSWDVLHPFSFIKKLIRHLRKPGEPKNAFLFILFHTLFFLIMYVAFGMPFYFRLL